MSDYQNVPALKVVRKPPEKQWCGNQQTTVVRLLALKYTLLTVPVQARRERLRLAHPVQHVADLHIQM
jgi:hypothetical protein